MPGQRADLPRFPDATETYDRQNEQDYRRTVEQSLLSVIHATTIAPVVQARATRSGTSASLELDITDWDRRVTAVEFNKREGTGAATGWVSTWDTSTGTAGTDKTLTRVEAISVPVGLDSAAEWRVKYRDQQGSEHIIGGAVPSSNLASVNKTLRLPFTQLVPDRDSGNWLYDATSGWLEPNVLNVEQIYAGSVVLPRGVTISAFRARMYRQTGSDLAIATLYMSDDSSASIISDALTHVTTAAWATLSDSTIGQVVDDEMYWVRVRLKGVADGSDARLSWVEVDYTVPDYSKAY